MAFCLKVTLMALALLAMLTTASVRCDEDAAADPLSDAIKPGLIGRYSAGEGAAGDEAACARIDPSIAFDWSDGTPDDRLPDGPFSVNWEGVVRIDHDDVYRFSAIAGGAVRIWVDERLVYASGPQAIRGATPLTYGYHPIRVSYVAQGHKARVRLVWSSDHFGPETVNPRYLAHPVAVESGVARQLLHDRGREIVERYGCARCHAIPGVDRTRRPGLAMPQASQINRDWLARWLRDPQSVRPGTRMGSPGGTPAEIEELISLLLVFLRMPDITERIEPKWRCGDRRDPLDGRELGVTISAGRKRFYELGCSACHAPENPREIDATRAPSLADLGSKWSKAYLRELLQDPLGRHPNGGMPGYQLNRTELDGLVAYMSRFHGLDPLPGVAARTSTARAGHAGPGAVTASQPDPQVLEQGKRLIQRRGCYACHHHPENKLMEGPVLGATSKKPATGCLRPDRAASVAPFYLLKPDDRAAVETFLAGRPPNPSQVASGELAEKTIRHRLDCFACHLRDGAGGEQLARTLTPYLASDRTANKTAILPPDLSGVGSRLLPAWIDDSLAGNAPSNRPWLTVAMPRFWLTDAERTQIARRLAVADEIPGLAAGAQPAVPAELQSASTALLGSRGFNCANCHWLGTGRSQDTKSAPDLSLASRRVSRAWYDRWLAGPSRIVPGTPMPAFTVPAAGIANEDFAIQREVLWRHLEGLPAGRGTGERKTTQ